MIYWKSRGETNSLWPNKSVRNTELLFRNFFEMLSKETKLYYFQNQGKYDSSSKRLKWVDDSIAEMQKFFAIIILFTDCK
jgi:hypothetical protein